MRANPTARILHISLLLASALLGCDGGGRTLLVDVLTNLRPAVDFDQIEIARYAGSGALAEIAPLRMVVPASGRPAGIRAAELSGVARGEWLVQARLLRRGAEVARGRVLVAFDADQLVTILVTSECAGIDCPGSGDPALAACLAGRCVDPRCSPETPELCPPAECAADAECAPGGPDCVRGLCFTGACVSFANDLVCGGGGTCDRERGCVGGLDGGSDPDAGPLDAGPPDAGATELNRIVQISVGLGHACALSDDGVVFCWGANSNGQLGDGTTIDRARAVQVVGLMDIDEVGAGNRITCARGGGSVWCWGENQWGQLGTGTGVDSATPRAISGISPTVDLAVGDHHVCALVDIGTARCWGRGDVGQLGNDSMILINPSPSTVVGETNLVQVEAGQLHTCVRRATRELLCFGLNAGGQLGDGTTTRRLVPTLVPSLDVADMALGFSHTCARTAAGEVSCWGQNGEGEVGDGTTMRRVSPVPVPGLSGALSIGGGGEHACARTASGAFCWGRNDDGQLGDATTMQRLTPTAVVGLGALDEVSAHRDHTCALLPAGTVECWGANDAGQLGDGTTTNRSTPAPVTY